MNSITSHPSRRMRRLAVLASLAGLLVLAGVSPAALAQAFPSRPIRLIVPAAPGGSTDILARVLGKIIQEQAGVPVVVDNRAGAAGSIGVSAAVHAPANGYTLLISVPDAVTVYPLMKKDVPYRVEKDLTPIALIANTHYVFAVSGASPARSVQDFVALAKSGKLTYASQGSGSSGQLVSEMFKLRTGADLLHVPYKGVGPAMVAVIGREADMIATSPASLKSFVDGGQLRALATTSERRLDTLPDVPTMAESGYADFVIPAWWGVFAPANLDPALADKLHDIMVAAIASPEFQKQAVSMQLELEPMERQAFGTMLAAESIRWKQLIDSAKIRIDE